LIDFDASECLNSCLFALLARSCRRVNKETFCFWSCALETKRAYRAAALVDNAALGLVERVVWRWRDCCGGFDEL
jgi:hypothetical protein